MKFVLENIETSGFWGTENWVIKSGDLGTWEFGPKPSPENGRMTMEKWTI